MKFFRMALFIFLLSMIPSDSFAGSYKGILSDTEVHCLARMIYSEARGEGQKGMVAVAYVAINRAQDPKYPNTLCGVVKQPYQFEGMTKPFKPEEEPSAWKQSRDVAILTITGMLPDITNGAKYFHTPDIFPSWAKVKERVYLLGNHIFYR